VGPAHVRPPDTVKHHAQELVKTNSWARYVSSLNSHIGYSLQYFQVGSAIVTPLFLVVEERNSNVNQSAELGVWEDISTSYSSHSELK